MDILLNNPREAAASKLVQPAMTFFPVDGAKLELKEEPVPGAQMAELNAEQPKAEEATTIQKHFRGYLTRKWRHGVEHPAQPFNRNLHYLKNFDSTRLFLPANTDLEAGDRYRLLGMDLPELLAAAHCDPPAPDRENLPTILLNRYTRLDPRLHIPVDKLNWKVEESYTNLEFKKKLNKSLAKSASKSAQSIQVHDLGYSDDFEDQIGAMDTSRKKSSQGSDSYIEDLVQSKSLSASRRQITRRSRGPKRGAEELNKQSSILDNESSGFGFLQDQKPNQINKSASRLNTEQSEEDSNPFGVARKPNPAQARKDSDNFQDSVEDLTQGPAQQRFPNSPRDKPQRRNKFKEHQAPINNVSKDHDFGAPIQKKPPSLELDPKIYSDLAFPELPSQREAAITKSNGQTSKLVAEELQRMKAVVSELEELNALDSPTKMGNPHKGLVIKKMAENEALTKRLINKIMFAREQTWEFAQNEQQELGRDEDLQHLIKSGIREAMSELRVPGLAGPGPLESLQKPQAAGETASQVYEAAAAPDKHKPFDELYFQAAGSAARLQSADRLSEQQYISDLENRVRKLKQVEADFNEAALARKAELERETEKRDRERAISRELAARRRQFAAKYDIGRFEPRRPPAPAEDAQTNKSGRSQARLAGSGVVSDYSESKEQIQNISWVESEVSGKKTNKFTVFS